MAAVITGAACLVAGGCSCGKKDRQKAVLEGHSKAFTVEPFEGITISAGENALDKDKHPVPEQYPRMRQVIELRNFLKDIDRADLPWEDYLVTAVLLGCGMPMRSRVPASLSVGLDAVIQMAAYFEEAYRNESMSNWYQSNG